MIRLYHTPTEEMIDVFSDLTLMVLPQPNNSTWKNARIDTFYGLAFYIRNFYDLYGRVFDYPFLFAFNAGNEIEFLFDGNHVKALSALDAMIDRIHDELPFLYSPLTYASYLTYMDYDVDFLSINMLDTGITYWDFVLDRIQKVGKPFLATEL